MKFFALLNATYCIITYTLSWSFPILNVESADSECVLKPTKSADKNVISKTGYNQM